MSFSKYFSFFPAFLVIIIKNSFILDLIDPIKLKFELEIIIPTTTCARNNHKISKWDFIFCQLEKDIFRWKCLLNNSTIDTALCHLSYYNQIKPDLPAPSNTFIPYVFMLPFG
jgi:hypothetical protein